jgi:hypothetical protein
MKWLPVLAAFVVLACGGNVVVDQGTGGASLAASSSGTGGSSSCQTGFGECFTFIGLGAGHVTCSGVGSMVLTSCPPGIGTCTGSGMGSIQSTVVTYYANLGQSAAMLQANCVATGGVWSN